MLKKIIVLAVIFTALSFTVPVLADEPSPTPTESPSPTPTPEIDAYTKLDLVKGGSFNINTMMYYYHNVLSEEQQKIVRFLIGTYNYMYVSARGFSYEDVTDLDDFIDKFDEFASFIVGIDSNYVETNTSRWSTNFQIYIASIITYAGNINVSFDTWIQSIAPNLIIPFSNDALDAWTEFYNDPSNQGIADFGSEERAWSSGITYPFVFEDYAFINSAHQSIYSNFILDYSPVLFSNIHTSGNHKYQYIFSFKDLPLIDTVYILRGQSGFQFYRYGSYDGNFYNNTSRTLRLELYNSKIICEEYAQNFTINNSIINIGTPSTIQVLLDDAFNRGIIKTTYSGYDLTGDWYPYLSHVVLVDDLNTLANRQDVYNDYTLGLITDYDWIKKPKNNNLPYWWKPLDFDVIIEQPNGDVDNSSDDDFTQNIVNNTVINNYDIVAPGVTINVPVDWFDGDYLEYTYNTGLPFFVFVGDVFNSLGELRINILGVLIFGLVSGIIVKFLQ